MYLAKLGRITPAFFDEKASEWRRQQDDLRRKIDTSPQQRPSNTPSTCSTSSPANRPTSSGDCSPSPGPDQLEPGTLRVVLHEPFEQFHGSNHTSHTKHNGNNGSVKSRPRKQRHFLGPVQRARSASFRHGVPPVRHHPSVVACRSPPERTTLARHSDVSSSRAKTAIATFGRCFLLP